jgi:hypothetical protein
MKKLLLSLFLLGMMPVCFGDAGEVNEREVLCAKMGHLAKQIVTDRDVVGVTKEEMMVEFTHLYNVIYGENESELKTKMLEFVEIVYDNKEDKTPSGAYATQYTRCLTKGYFEY